MAAELMGDSLAGGVAVGVVGVAGQDVHGQPGQQPRAGGAQVKDVSDVDLRVDEDADVDGGGNPGPVLRLDENGSTRYLARSQSKQNCQLAVQLVGPPFDEQLEVCIGCSTVANARSSVRASSMAPVISSRRASH